MKYPKTIIINADDFGISLAANMAIADLYVLGKISSATIMVNMGESSLEALRLAKELKIPVGLHFNLTLGKPLGDDLYDLIDDNGNFFERKIFEKKLWWLPKKEVLKELTRQYAFMIAHGVNPTHIDSHQHIHNWPRLFRMVLLFAKQKGVNIRIVMEPIVFFGNPFTRIGLKQVVRKSIFYLFGVYNLWLATYKRVKHNSSLSSFFALLPRPAKMSLSDIDHIVSKLKNQGEYMIHPLTIEKGTRTSITAYSVQEYKLLKQYDFSKLTLKSY